MKHVCMMLAAIWIASGVQAVQQIYRDFTDTQGRTIRARIVSVDSAAGKVKIERDNRRTATVPISLFIEKDQTYIKEWELIRLFSSDRYFVISVKRKKKENKDRADGSYIANRKVEDVFYEVTVQNKSPSLLKDITFEYCIFYEQEERGKNYEGVHCGRHAVESIAPRAKKMFNTQAVAIYREELNADYIWASGADNVQDGEVRGVWIRAHMTLPSGKKSTREYCLPDSVNNSRTWTTSSKDVGMN